ncbi:MAG: PH domain-containing protein [bacterium]
MIVRDRPYSLGYQAAIAMVLGSIKYPVLIGGGLVLLHWLVSVFFAKSTFAILLFGKPYHVALFFVCTLVLFLGLAVLPEYFGFSFLAGEKGLYIRSGILSHTVTAIAYKELTNVEIVRSKTFFGMSDFAVSWHRHGKDEETVLPCLSRKMRTDLFTYLTRS